MGEVKAVNGTVSFDGQFVTIARTGFIARATIGKGDKRIPIGSVTAVQWKPAGLMNGYIAFTLAGGNEARSRFGSATMDASKDENAVVFSTKHQGAMQVLRDEIEVAIAAGSAPVVQQVSAADELAKYAALRDQGVISDDEFAAKKAAILGL